MSKDFDYEANGLSEKYPEIFHGETDIAKSYLIIVDCIKEIDKEFVKTHSIGEKHSKTLIKFLEKKIQFESKTNFYLTMEDVIRFAQVCTSQNNLQLKKIADRTLDESKRIMQHLVDALFKHFDFTNFSALSELNIKQLDESKERGDSLLPTKRKF
ncbi:MAG: hypothetical protein BGO43_13455 [Gammaproteobacteria bacterium 39-13]|nr:hypothetical protein [Gammaproteobacteria bacterium]OJV85732.1 MAG: hypothetical protein BGO43_13455 [Gammaproteobacteria bacterium 39-13]